VEITEILGFVASLKKIKGLKLAKNKLTTEGLHRLLDLIPAITNLNLSSNQLTDDAVTQLLANRQKVPQLRIVNLSNNRINERRARITI
jgi:Ran GTPase-activating protein (RanGAP) involved in mRNA processing and transport